MFCDRLSAWYPVTGKVGLVWLGLWLTGLRLAAVIRTWVTPTSTSHSFVATSPHITRVTCDPHVGLPAHSPKDFTSTPKRMKFDNKYNLKPLQIVYNALSAIYDNDKTPNAAKKPLYSPTTPGIFLFANKSCYHWGLGKRTDMLKNPLEKPIFVNYSFSRTAGATRQSNFMAEETKR